MKIAISGKGGVGKTLVASLLARAFSRAGYSVIAIDADPDTNLAATLSFPKTVRIVPVAEMKELIQERTETRPGQSGTYFKMNPRVDDLPEKYSKKHEGIRLLVMGQMKRGGGGCYCPENALLAALMAHLLLGRNEVVILDMAAGIEHLSRGTARAVDKLIIVVEPGRASLETAFRVRELAADIGLTSLAVVANKIHDREEKEAISARLGDFKILGFVPYDQALVEADMNNLPVLDASQSINSAVEKIFHRLEAAGVKS
jgi:CO dehydrogenase maturation factor